MHVDLCIWLYITLPIHMWVAETESQVKVDYIYTQFSAPKHIIYFVLHIH